MNLHVAPIRTKFQFNLTYGSGEGLFENFMMTAKVATLDIRTERF